MSWTALFDRSHIVKGVPVDALIELQCKQCKTLFHTKNAYYVGYSSILYANPSDQGKCNHRLKDLKLTNRWLPTRDIHNVTKNKSWASLFDHSHILDNVPIDACIELKCKKCNTLFHTKNAYYVGYSDIHYANPDEDGKCKHSSKDLQLTKKWFATHDHDKI